MKALRTSALPLLLTVAALLAWSGCAKVYTAPETAAAVQEHHLMAVLPPAVSIAAQRKVDGEAQRAQERTDALAFQQEMVTWLLKRKQQGRLQLEVQDAQTTLVRLERAGYTGLNSMTADELARALGVDAVMTSTFRMSKPMSTGGAIASQLLLGYGSSNEVAATVSLYDGKTGRLLWNYDQALQGGAVSSATMLVDNLMRSATKKMPYAEVARTAR